MSEMVERVARELAAADLEEVLRAGMVGRGSPADQAVAAVLAVDELWPQYAERAKRAIKAIGEPTEAMARFGAKAMMLDATHAQSIQMAKAGFRFMITAALSEKEGA